MPLQATSGAASYDAFGGGVAAVPNYIEDVFSTWLYTGNGSTQTINNGIDLAGKGGLVWLKDRSQAFDHGLFDTARGAGYRLISNSTAAENFSLNYISSFNSNGFSLGAPSSSTNTNGDNYVSWTFREQPKFFDVVTWTGDNTNNRAITHSLGGTVGCLIVKRTSGTGDWPVWHRSLPAYGANPQSKSTLYLNATLGGDADVYFGSTAPTSTAFYVDVAANASGNTYVAYLFAHNAGGFGLSGTDNVISCGSFTTDGSGNATVNLGYEPQWVLTKRTDSTGNWAIVDSMRGNATLNGTAETERVLFPNTSAAEAGSHGYANPTSTGFQAASWGGVTTQIYIAIRRGPMKTPTTGTSVFSPNAVPPSSIGTPVTTGFPVDLQIATWRGGVGGHYFYDRLRGVSSTTTEGARSLESNSTAAETSVSTATRMWGNTGFQIDTSWSSADDIFWNFRRAPSVFDEVCYTGTNTTNTAIAHNLGVVPELVISKTRGVVDGWNVWAGGILGVRSALLLESTSAIRLNYFNAGTPATATNIYEAVQTGLNSSTNVVYLFASCLGVSKVGSFTGTGSTQVINCGFTGGARFVLIKATSTTGNWLVWDSARGIVAGNDPYIALNSTAAEVTNTDWVDTAATGFELSNAGGNLANSSGVSYVFFAVA